MIACSSSADSQLYPISNSCSIQYFWYAILEHLPSNTLRGWSWYVFVYISLEQAFHNVIIFNVSFDWVLDETGFTWKMHLHCLAELLLLMESMQFSIKGSRLWSSKWWSRHCKSFIHLINVQCLEIRMCLLLVCPRLFNCASLHQFRTWSLNFVSYKKKNVIICWDSSLSWKNNQSLPFATAK